MISYFDTIEDAFVDRLCPLVDDYGYEVQALPDAKGELERPATRARVTVAYSGSRFGDKTSPGLPEILAVGIPFQEEFASFSIIIESDRRRGRGGCLEGLELTRRLLLGWEPAKGYGRVTAMDTKMVDYKDGFYAYELLLQTSRHIVPAITPQGEMGGLTEADYPPETSSPFVEARTTTNI